MLKQLFVLCPLFLVGCGQPSTKVDNREAISKCIASRHGQSDYALLTQCVPLSQPTRLEGTWFLGFEESAFNSGYTKVPAMSDDRGIPLVYSDTATKTLPIISDGRHAAYQVAFIGRRTLLSEPMLQRIVVDTIISMKEVPRLQNSSERAADR